VYVVDMGEGPDPDQEAVVSRVLKAVQSWRKAVDALVALEPAKRRNSLTLHAVRRHPDMVALRSLAAQDLNFRGYLLKKLTASFGDVYARTLLELFGS